jgi:hypothetical protein
VREGQWPSEDEVLMYRGWRPAAFRLHGEQAGGNRRPGGRGTGRPGR